jgi:L-fucose isomerase-like protein
MSKTAVLYVPIGRKTFDLEAAENVRLKSMGWLNENCQTVAAPEGIITSVEELDTFLFSIKENKFDTVLYQSVTFADGEFVIKVLEYFKQPMIVWSVREPSVGGRLRLNSLTGGNSTSNVLRNQNHPFAFVFGNPGEERLEKRLTEQLDVMRVMALLGEMKIGVVGDYPPGFFFSDADEDKLKQALGVKLLKMDLHDAFKNVQSLKKKSGLDKLNERNNK